MLWQQVRHDKEDKRPTADLDQLSEDRDRLGIRCVQCQPSSVYETYKSRERESVSPQRRRLDANVEEIEKV